MEIYRNIPLPPSCRAAGTWPPSSQAAGAYPQKTRKIIADRSLGPVARLPGGRPPALYIKVLAARHPQFGLLKIQKKRKEREG